MRYERIHTTLSRSAAAFGVAVVVCGCSAGADPSSFQEMSEQPGDVGQGGASSDPGSLGMGGESAGSSGQERLLVLPGCDWAHDLFALRKLKHIPSMWNLS